MNTKNHIFILQQGLEIHMFIKSKGGSSYLNNVFQAARNL